MVKQAFLIFKTHLDIGYTNYAENVIELPGSVLMDMKECLKAEFTNIIPSFKTGYAFAAPLIFCEAWNK